MTNDVYYYDSKREGQACSDECSCIEQFKKIAHIRASRVSGYLVEMGPTCATLSRVSSELLE